MRLTEIDDDFSNQSTTLDHLFRVQAARCHEYITLITSLKRKYPTLLIIAKYEELVLRPPINFPSPTVFETKVASLGTLNLGEIIKVVQKYSDMLDAKNAYVHAGGTKLATAT